MNQEDVLVFLKNLDWGIILGILAILVAIFIGYYQVRVNKKVLKFLIVSQSPLVSFDKDYRHNLQIIYKGKEINQALSTIIRIRNSGNQPIRVEDYYRPISFEYEPNIELLSASIIKTKPSNLRTNVSIIDNQVTLENLLINPKDYIEFYFITSTFVTPIVNARIAGVSNIRLESTDYIIGESSVSLILSSIVKLLP